MSKQEYIAPELTVVTFKVEQGFQASGQSLMQQLDLFNFNVLSEDDYNSYGHENWTTADDSYFGSGW